MDSEDRIFDVSVRRQFRFGSFKLALDPVGIGYQPRALLRASATGLSLTRVNAGGKPIKRSSSIFPTSWTWHWNQVVGAQTVFLSFTGWGVPPTRLGLRLDIHGESFYPLLATYELDDLVKVLQDQGVAVDRTPRRLNWSLTGRR
jgi:hypothetical protein